MRLREFLMGTALMSFALITTAKANSLPAFNEDVRNDFGDDRQKAIEAGMSLPIPPSPLISADKVLGSAYYDTLTILSTNNRCSDFFGGPAASVDIFNELISKARKDYFPVSIAMRMSGRTINFINAETKKQYGLFEKVSININGPFYRKRFADSDPSIPRVGTFKPNTKEVRVLILLHELGHVVKGPEGNWLLPDDGKNEEQSRLNSQKIEDVCGDQIKDLGKTEATNFARRKLPA